MVVVKVNNSKILLGRYGVMLGILSLSVSTMVSLNLPAYAGSQSLLDPYANVQAPLGQTTDRPLGERTSTKKPRSAGKLKSANSNQKSPDGQLSSTANSASANPGFLSGIKEIQHGSVTSFKAMGHGIVNGSKAAGAKIAAAGGKVKDGISAAEHKIKPEQKAVVAKAPATKNKKKNRSQSVATANSQTRARSAIDSPVPVLPGKPLGPVANTLPHPAKVKLASVGPKKKNIVARTFDKINPFAKHNTNGTDIANNGIAH